MPYKDPEVRKAYHRGYHKKWYAEHKKARRKQIRMYKVANPEKIAEYHARPESRARAAKLKSKWRLKYRLHDNRTKRLWSRRNPETVSEYSKSYYHKHRESKIETNREYRNANREYLCEMQKRRYVRERDRVTDEAFEQIKAKVGSKTKVQPKTKTKAKRGKK